MKVRGVRLGLGLLVAVALTFGIVTMTGPGAVAARGPIDVGRLGPGDRLFWHGPFVKSASTFAPAKEACAKGRCFNYRFEVTKTAPLLRVAVDVPYLSNSRVALILKNPRGRTYRPQSRGFHSLEIFVRKPRPGPWLVQVVPRDLDRTAFRLRAHLGKAKRRASEGRRLLAPNLRMEAPFQLTFRPPPSYLTLAQVFVGLPSTDTPCSAVEMVEGGARECLRLSVGPQNAGVGPLLLKFSPATDAATARAPMHQVLRYSDGSSRRRRAGRYEYHKVHGHYHFAGFASLDLLRVKNARRGVLRPAGAGHKQGFCFGDVLMNSWHRFIHARAGQTRQSCESLDNARLGLSAGWTDIYDWGTDGNYVEFAGNGDGRYVVQATVDARDKILESNERDNTSYTYFRVRGQKIRILERGFGRSPWDPDKRVVKDWVDALKRKRR